MLRISVAPSSSTVIVRMKGSVEAPDATPTFNFMNEVILEDYKDVLVDLSRCEDLDSTIMGALLVMHERHAKNGGTFCLVNVGEHNKRALKLLGVSKVVPVNKLKFTKWPRFVPVDLRAFCGRSKDRIEVIELAHRALVKANEQNAERFGSFLNLLDADKSR